MLFIDNKGITDARVNLAIEEYILKNLDINESYLLFYINGPSIIIGKNQNTAEEINQSYVDEKGIHVVRRLSGGGAVYHDLGNLNFSFITKDDGDSFHNFQKFTEPVVQALQSLGVNAQLSGRNDIEADGRKISGNAQFSTKGRMFSHGTLLFDAHMEDVVAALNVKQEKIQSKGIKSVRSRVANIKEFLSESMTIEEFKKILLLSIFDTDDVTKVPTYELTDADWEKIHQLSKERYQTWEWNYGKSPAFNLQYAHRFPGGRVDLRLNVEKGIIKDCKVFGDFFGLGEIADIEKSLIGVKHNRADVSDALVIMEGNKYLGTVDKDEFVQMMF